MHLLNQKILVIASEFKGSLIINDFGTKIIYIIQILILFEILLDVQNEQHKVLTDPVEAHILEQTNPQC